MTTRAPMQTYTCGYYLRAPEEAYQAGVKQRDKEMRQALSWYLRDKRQAALDALAAADGPLEQALAQGRLSLANEMLEDARKFDRDGTFK